MQNAVIGMIVGVSFLGLTLVAVRSRVGGTPALRIQLALGAIVGALAGAIAVAMRADLVPDSVEGFVAVAIVIAAAITLTAIAVRHYGR
ncbi:MAG TPA: hypothetical protein VFN76_05045 [Candidatus Limnocylindria bacterium]|nr:hypothetical protein [Candidatus Limnocylindria bacterium]